jgi:hypothetical protein
MLFCIHDDCKSRIKIIPFAAVASSHAGVSNNNRYFKRSKGSVRILL